MKILGLDTGTKTGWAFWGTDENRLIESGVQDFSKRRGESNGLMFMRFRNWLFELIEDSKPRLVAYELAHHRGGAATEIAVGLTTRVQEICANIQVEYASVHTATLKKWSTGNGRAGKHDMIVQAAKFKVPYYLDNASYRETFELDDNEADAILIAAYAAQKYGSDIHKLERLKEG